MFFARRESLWRAMLNRVSHGGLRVFEFGVAWGYCTAWWLRHSPNPNMQWDGFDRFVGLPRDWRDFQSGHFDAGGHPRIQDNRITWHVGDVEEKIQICNLSRDDGRKWLLFFDLDIYEPSLIVWNRMKASLRSGDLIYFEEAFDRDERHLLDHHILPSSKFSLVGATPMALCLEVLEIFDHFHKD